MDIEQFLRDAGVPFKVHDHPPAYTAQELAAGEHVSGDNVAKPVAIKTGDEHVLCVLPASHKIDLGKLKKVLKARKKCRILEESEMAKLFPDIEVGAETPFGQPYGLPTVVDEHLAQCETITFAAGSHRRAIQMTYADYARLAEPTVADFSVHL